MGEFLACEGCENDGETSEGMCGCWKERGEHVMLLSYDDALKNEKSKNLTEKAGGGFGSPLTLERTLHSSRK